MTVRTHLRTAQGLLDVRATGFNIDRIRECVRGAIEELDASTRETYTDGRHRVCQGDYLIVLDPYQHPDA